MKKCLGFILAIVISMTSIQGVFAIEGTGSSSNPYLISSVEDWQEIMRNIRDHKNWSDGKHFSLESSIAMTGASSLSYSNFEGHVFNGIFKGNGRTITLAGSSVFGYLGKAAEVSGLHVTGAGNFGERNEGKIRFCTSSATAPYGFVSENQGLIQDCSVNGTFTTAGIAGTNRGEISRCYVSGTVTGCGAKGLVDTNYGEISHCKVEGLLKDQGGYASGLVGHNYGKVKNSTMNGPMEGSNCFYLIYSLSSAESLVKKCVVGEKASGAKDEQLFGSTMLGKIDKCGFVGWDHEDYCKLISPQVIATSAIIEVSLHAIEGAKIVGDVAFGVIASATDSFIKTPIEIVAWATPESGAKDFLQELAGAWGDVSQALEDMSSNPKVFKVSKIGADVAGIVIGVGGTVKAITKTGQIVKVGKASQGLNYMISGGAAALARDVVFVADGTALAGAAKSVAKGVMLAAGSGKTGFEDLESLGESDGGGESKPKAPTKVNNMHEFFETEFGQTLKGKSRKTHYMEHGQSVYEVTTKIDNPHLDRGDLFYMDKMHGDHIEVFTGRGNAKTVLNLDGTVNEAKKLEVLQKARTIDVR